MQHVLTVLVFWSWVRLPLRLGATDCSPALAFCFMGAGSFVWICCLQLPCHPCKNRTHSTSFTAQGRHAPIKGGVVLRLCGCSRLSAFACNWCAFVSVFGPISGSVESAFVCVCARLFAFVCVRKQPCALKTENFCKNATGRSSKKQKRIY